MNVTYVSALYNIYDSSSVSTRLLNDVNIMLKQKMRLILFVDDFYYDMIQIISKNDSVMIVKLHIEDLHIYNIFICLVKEVRKNDT